jgi:hypothetical protein
MVHPSDLKRHEKSQEHILQAGQLLALAAVEPDDELPDQQMEYVGAMMDEEEVEEEDLVSAGPSEPVVQNWSPADIMKDGS